MTQQQHSDKETGTEEVIQVAARYVSSIYAAYWPAGETGIIPSATGAVVANSLIRLEGADVPAGVRRILATSSAKPESTCTALGWLIAINQGSQANAKIAMDKFLKDEVSGNLMKYGGNAVVPDTAGSNVAFLPANEKGEYPLSQDLTDVYIAPVDAATPTVGVSYLTLSLGVPSNG